MHNFHDISSTNNLELAPLNFAWNAWVFLKI